jgi:segregation and condensation protein B
MFATTRKFLDYFNLKNLDDLPTLSDIRDLDKINQELNLDQFIDDAKAEALADSQVILEDDFDEDTN